MENLRNIRLSKQIQKDLSDIIDKIVRDNYRGKMVSVTEVRLSSDYSYAKIFLSVFPTDNAQTIVDEIELINKQIRFDLGNRMRNQMRKIPELRFQLDVSLDELEKIDKLLKNDGIIE
ncbi:MAG: 30S ribosome-binding factor RbfA [Bacteroidales bacterium]|nr:30S ribosome-binding factor RbfA [Bacteroidales bacterium]